MPLRSPARRRNALFPPARPVLPFAHFCRTPSPPVPLVPFPSLYVFFLLLFLSFFIFFPDDLFLADAVERGGKSVRFALSRKD